MVPVLQFRNWQWASLALASPGELLRLAGAVEDASGHPVAVAIAAGARERLPGGKLPVAESFTSAPGLGVSGVVEGLPWRSAVAAGWKPSGDGSPGSWPMPSASALGT